MTRHEEIEAKVERVRAFMGRRECAAVALNSQANFAWITAGGDNHVGLSSEGGVATVVITLQGRHVIASTIEAPRMEDEEGVAELGFELHRHPWHEDRVGSIVAELAPGGTIAADHALAGAVDMSPQIARLRWRLLGPEIERYRQVGEASAHVVEEVGRQVEPGMTEMAIAGLMQGKAFAAGLLPNVCLVAADERAFLYRHPVPTDRRVDRHVMLAIGARRGGLAVSATRLAHFGGLPDELVHRHGAVCEVDACLILESQPGAKVCDLFGSACEVYARRGFPDEWKLHHQGGATGYAAREYRGSPTSEETVLESQAFAWNPSIAGTKSEDTIVVTAEGPEVLSQSGAWPMLTVEYEGRGIERPAILQR